jgi:hypothetical protein
LLYSFKQQEKEVMQIRKPINLMILPMALLLVFSLLTGCAQNKGAETSGVAAVELTDSTVRVPPGDPTAFWDAMGWSELTKAEQALWGVLGWDEASYEGEAKAPASEDKYWRTLNDAERDACEKLGYTKRLWDNS